MLRVTNLLREVQLLIHDRLSLSTVRNGTFFMRPHTHAFRCAGLPLQNGTFAQFMDSSVPSSSLPVCCDLGPI